MIETKTIPLKPVDAIPRYENGQVVALWNKKQVAEYLGVSTRTIDRRMANGDIPFRKEGGTVRFDPNVIQSPP